ncbi:unnamed protein product, partial [Mesorhabditis belari]|uniref:C-type lectin domain-containing protein n=1 Tax=Mesorhabditis belari TaxID=2138241 RepID=A0AAF3J850_9BILA
MGVMAVGLFITIPLLFHQISSSIQQADHVDPSTSPIDRDENLSGDRRTFEVEDCPDTVRLRSCQRNWNETQQELVEARGKISELAETKRKNDDLEAQLRTQNTEVRDGKAKIGELEGKINALQSENSDLETQINRTMTWIWELNGWSYLAKTASWYKAFDQRMTFDEVEAYCANRKSQLVSIHSQEENDFVWGLAKDVNSMWGFWIGLKKIPRRRQPFEWTDGSSVDFTNWNEGRPGSSTHTYLGSGDGKWLLTEKTHPKKAVYARRYQWGLICKRRSPF